MLTSGLFFSFKDSTLHYSKAGTGTNVLLMFHGFGQNHAAFEELINAHETEYTYYSFDLFFHGKSHWGYGEDPVEKEFWLACIQQFLEENSIDRFSLASFSLGARFVFVTLEGIAHRIDKVFLIAPDGIKTSLWYSLATYPIPLRKYFKSMIPNPKSFFSLARVLLNLKLIDKGLIRFAESQMNTEEKRRRVYYAWVVFRHLEVNIGTIANHINQQAIPVTMILGEYDNVITQGNMKRFLSRLQNAELVLLKTGHNGLISAVAKENLLQPK